MEVEQKNKLALRRLQLVEDYVNVMKGVEQGLNQHRLLFSKAKNVIGFSTASALFVDNREMEASKLVNDNFDIEEVDGAELFTPFGLFEPLALKQSRKAVEMLYSRFSELAVIRKELAEVEKELGLTFKQN